MPGQNPEVPDLMGDLRKSIDRASARRRGEGYTSGPEEMTIPSVPDGPGPGSEAADILAEAEAARGTKPLRCNDKGKDLDSRPCNDPICERTQVCQHPPMRRDPHFVADPTLSEMLAKFRVPEQHHEAVKRAVGDWLMTWPGNLANAVARTTEGQRVLDTVQDETIRQLVDRARGGR